MSAEFVSYLPDDMRARWGVGEWNAEPDRIEWRDEATGLACLALRQPTLGHWCGYVGVGAAHPAHGEASAGNDLEVHGGITFTDFCQPAGKLGEHRVCHTPEPGETEHTYWFGFDCAHAGDLLPWCRERAEPTEWDTYRTLDYVRRECARLAQQLAGSP